MQGGLGLHSIGLIVTSKTQVPPGEEGGRAEVGEAVRRKSKQPWQPDPLRLLPPRRLANGFFPFKGWREREGSASKLAVSSQKPQRCQAALPGAQHRTWHKTPC